MDRCSGSLPARLMSAISGVAALALLAGCVLPTIPTVTSQAADDLRHAEPAYTAAPPGHPFAVVEQGMATGDVRTVLGKPSSLRRYPTMWTFVPFYTGAEERRTVWSYPGQGRILFGDHPRSGELEVIRVEFDPREDGV